MNFYRLNKLDYQHLRLRWMWVSGTVSAAIALTGSPAYAEGQLSDQSVSSQQASEITVQRSVTFYKTPIATEGMPENPISKHFDVAIVGAGIDSPLHVTEALPLDSLAQTNPTDQEPLELPSEAPSELQPFEQAPEPTLLEPETTDLSQPLEQAPEPTSPEPETTDLSQPFEQTPEPETTDSTQPFEQAPEPETTDSPQPLEQDSEPTSPEPETTDSSAALTSPEGWQFSLSPYFFAPFDINADITVSGRSTSIDLGLDDVLNFDRAFNGGLRLEGQNDRWGIILDGFYLYGEESGSLGESFSARSLIGFVRQTSADRLDEFVQQFDPQRLERLTQIGQIIGQRVDLNTPVSVTASGSASVRQIKVDLAVSYRAVDVSLDNSPDADFYPRLVVSPIAGLRTNFLRQTIEVDDIRIANRTIPDDALPSIDREFSESITLVEPLLGAEIELALSEQWELGLRGDISGFGIGADRNLTWNLAFGAQYNISPNVGLQLLYRFNSFEYENGDGLDRIRLDLEQNGLLLTTIFRF